ncbi:DgyrCDS5753 [Dimorphilus gyrociliatus]|uniref:DgyrCDS5753 n=1 Tax=Dimorphilus gyrociliatus TaxID=2664684 RepID=A0A7I8VKU9_9ANNE|nr:DgyrCDS5753 [Dimorphilus gyrociliatus]
MTSPNDHLSVPDGGWGWIVVISSFYFQALTIGITYTFGVKLVKLKDEFKVNERIIAGPLIKRFGWRTVAITGSVLSTIGFVSSSFVKNVYVLYFTYGVMTGIGNGLMYVTSMVCVQHYFDTKRALATGLAVSGSGVGTLLFGWLDPLLLKRFQWRKTLLIEAAIMLSGAFFGALYKPLPNGDYENDTDLLKEDADSIKYDEDNKQEPNENTPLTNSGERMRENNGTSYSDILVQEPVSTCCGIKCKNAVFDLSLFTNPIFIMFCSALTLFCFGYHVPYTYTPDRVIQLLGKDNIKLEKASLLISYMGISNVASRLIFGWFADKSPRARFYLGSICLTLGGAISMLITFFNTYGLMVFYSVLFGAFTGCWASLFPVILVDLLGIDVIERSLGQSLAIASFAFLFASPLSAFIKEKTKSYDVSFWVVGTAEAIGGFILLSIKIVQWYQRRKWRKMPQEKYAERPTKVSTSDSIKKSRRRFISESFA